MKAPYKKPLLEVEVFSLTQSVALDCADNIPKERLNFNDPGQCVWDLGGGTTVFVAGSCTIDASTMGIYCYNNPSEGQYIFRS